jgi:ATP-dependent DNA helicase RecQ
VIALANGEEAAWWRDALRPAVSAAAPVVGGRCVLLLVDATSSGWPVTVAAAHLRRAGAVHVLPLVVHRGV